MTEAKFFGVEVAKNADTLDSFLKQTEGIREAFSAAYPDDELQDFVFIHSGEIVNGGENNIPEYTGRYALYFKKEN